MSKLSNHDEPIYFFVSDYKPIITYAGDTELFKNLEATLCQALPQEATEWRRLYARELKSVKLSAVFEPFSEAILQNENRYHFLKQPILHVFWTQCADVDTYKNGLSEEIKTWMQILQRHNINDWLIVLVEAYDFRKHNKLLPRTTVLDKIKNDFGVKHVDRCLSVINPLKSEFRTGSSWRALVVNMRLLILTAYDNTLLKFAEYIRMQRESRKQPDWNFCDYFLLQEEYAFALEMLGVHEEALIQYDELEALFSQFIKNSSLTDAPKWLSIFQTPVDTWSGLVLTCKVNLNHREAIRNHRIPLLDFRCYLFCRQAAMLSRIAKPWEIAQRTLPFIHNCLNEIRILGVQYPEGALSCWILLCCLEVIFTCQIFKESAAVDLCPLYTAALMEMAIVKLGHLGELCGLMPDCEQTSEQLHTVVSLSAGIGDPSHLHQSNSVSPIYQLKDALLSKDAFSKHYLELCEQTMITYKHKKRMRSARYIGKLLADFYIRLGSLSKASGFLVNSLSLYEDDNWPVLANHTRLQVLQCHKQMNDSEKLLKTCISIASSTQFDLQLRLACFDNFMKILQDNAASECIVSLEDGFSLKSATIEVQYSGLRGQTTLNIENKFPADVRCSHVGVTVSEYSNNGSGKARTNNDSSKAKKIEAADMEYFYEKFFRSNAKPLVPSEIPLVRILDYQQDKSLAGTRIVCKNSESYLRRQDSQKQKKSNVPTKGNSAKVLKMGPIILKPGINSIILASEEDENNGTYSLGQLSINVENKLLFLSAGSYLSIMKYTINHVAPTITIKPTNNNALLVGIPSTVNLCVNLGTYVLAEDKSLKLRASNGLTFALNERETLRNELTTDLRRESDGQNFCVPLLLKAEFPAHVESSTIDYKIFIQCPWSESEITLIVQFAVPFSVSYRIQTALLRKFLLVTIIGLTSESLILKNPELTIVLGEKLSIKSLNPSSWNHTLVVKNKIKAKFLWELINESEKFGECGVNFKISYDIFDFPCSYLCEFKLSNFTTLFSVESTVNPARGCEFCRVNTMCHLVFTVTQLASTTDRSLKYEVVTDQTMWAVCNMSTGVVILNETDKCSKTVDLMPLVHGNLPIPSIKLSKYFPAENNVGDKRQSPRLEPFYHGQIFNANKFTQVQVLPASSVLD